MIIRSQNLFEKVQPVLQSKVEEFKYYNYNAISKEQLWNYCIDKKWRKKNIEELALYEIVATIFAITPSEIVNYQHITDFKTAEWFTETSQEELEMLLKKHEE
ncbi:post-transcriptional regulator [Solibacillus sp. CAU 1738]|uniref:post-transcriptional regulator n=1 Tax=Solibacillus sp. CAU 1738 TaxID=3140363 RepID=UPI003261B85A